MINEMIKLNGKHYITFGIIKSLRPNVSKKNDFCYTTPMKRKKIIKTLHQPTEMVMSAH